MNSVKPRFVLGLLVASSLLFHNFSNLDPAAIVQEDILQLPTKDFSDCKRNGKRANAETFASTFALTPWEQLGFPEITEEMTLALQHQMHVLEKGKFRDGKSVGGLDVTFSDFKQVLQLLLERKGTQPNDLHRYLDAHQVKGKDKKGSVYFTGYYTPVLKVMKSKTGKYKYPIYAYPADWEGSLPTRQEIDGMGHLEGLGLELAYAANPVDIYIMQLQGSGYVEFVDTDERRLFRYAGDNGRKYKNIQRFFKDRPHLGVTDLSFSNIREYLTHNPELKDSVLFSDRSYTFFSPTKGLVKGAGNVPLMKTISVAADPDFFPAGSVLLATMPVVEEGRVTHHEYHLLLPQDVGGAIDGAGHLDIYCGVGEDGKKRANKLHHYGQIWLLTPKSNEQVAQNLVLADGGLN